ncbi:MAG: M15 family metallopeptidase [Treponema sp.]|nr:M15 family metallopeptidase [Treponema sp.]
MKIPRFIALGLIAAAAAAFIVFAAGAAAAAPRAQYSPIQESAGEAEEARPTRAELVTKALAAGYPGRVEKAEFREGRGGISGDWAVLVRGEWYYYAGGKLLPEELLDKADDYSPIAFYNYQRELPAWREPSAEQTARFGEMAANRQRGTRRRAPHFFDALWRAHDREESYQRVKSIRFLGHTVAVHYGILEELSLVEEHILAAAKADPQVQSWISNISEMAGWSWRNVANSQSRSYHSYGVAIDILPKSLGGRETYWLWASERKPDWWNIPYEDRFHPPDAVIKAFEAYGFVWGGKWPYFDTMHFEYRPEVFFLSGMDLSALR